MYLLEAKHIIDLNRNSCFTSKGWDTFISKPNVCFINVTHYDALKHVQNNLFDDGK